MERIARKLFTKEDRHNVHKVLGTACLLSFVYRYCHCWAQSGALQLGTPTFVNVSTSLLHMLLSSTSLLFRVLPKRIRGNPLVIYEEYRLHAILFSFRAVAVMWLTWARLSALAPMMLVAVHLTVDAVTRKHGTEGITTVRNDNTDEFLLMKRLYSFYQVYACASLFVQTGSADLGWNTLVAIQSSAFLMTLKRKAVISREGHAIGYSACLLVSAVYIYTHTPATVLAGAVCVFLARVHTKISKYFLWTAYWLATQYLG